MFGGDNEISQHNNGGGCVARGVSQPEYLDKYGSHMSAMKEEEHVSIAEKQEKSNILYETVAKNLANNV
jgi:hypothetical protein